MTNNNKSIFISAGDISGDIHAGNLSKSIKLLSQNCKISAIGGNELKKNVDVFIEDIVNVNAFGFFPIKQYFFLRKVFKRVKQYLIENKIEKVILVDYYGFNIHLAELASTLKIPVYYYVTPQIWASRKSRITKIAKYVKMVFPILPFEKDIYSQAGVNAVFEGNPLIDIVPLVEKEKELKNQITVGLFAGSRKNTIKRHLPIIINTVNILRDKINAKFVLFSLEKINECIPEYISVKYGDDFNERKKIDIAICPSGTVSLENALMGIPMIVMYKLSWANYLLARLIVKIKYITLANILSNKEIVPEYIQHNATPKKISGALLNQIKPENYHNTRVELLKFRQQLGDNGVCGRVAQKILGDNNGL
ncbi:MAG: lipid-A-disaccharide synthase [Endomicrobiia bacterium]|nr:lipid-A-disaccharide synthase [Endomicrobiaceae bacterium]MDD3053718.1 lipid-A-disaccharide synthase [Endomicrobiaceae bacterium]MDD5102198.1 lipid-A-disaccharide synthase [Endomicrobiaceae bacterium]